MKLSINNEIQTQVISNMQKNMMSLSPYACNNSNCFRNKPIRTDIRPDFFRDIDRIIYSLAYMRYIDKTQVFSQNDNDMISKRIIHVQLVSKVARTIGRALNLNEDLIEAATLGHDLGHAPFGHVGESILNDISVKYGEGFFNHNVQSVRILSDIENGGNGSNISIQVLDAILCHNGELLEPAYFPVSKSPEQFYNEYKKSYNDDKILKKIRPMTLEGCVVRISDVIAYIGKDIEDAIRLGVIDRNSIPREITNVLGTTNSEIVNNIIIDIINNSFSKNYIKMSENIFSAFSKLMKFNYENIYMKANTAEELNNYKIMFNDLCSYYMNALENNLIDCDIYKVFLNEMNDEYNTKNSNARKILDFVSGMTDDYFMHQYNKYCNNKNVKTKLLK